MCILIVPTRFGNNCVTPKSLTLFRFLVQFSFIFQSAEILRLTHCVQSLLLFSNLDNQIHCVHGVAFSHICQCCCFYIFKKSTSNLKLYIYLLCAFEMRTALYFRFLIKSPNYFANVYHIRGSFYQQTRVQFFIMLSLIKGFLP